jgi:enoyl-CoA hydratase
MFSDAALVRRNLLCGAALLTGLGAVPSPRAQAAAAECPTLTTRLAEVPFANGASLTVERRGQVALFGLNRPQIQNRIDPATLGALARAYYDYDPQSSPHFADFGVA